MQIISGMYRGRKLKLPDDARPTQNRARIALFNMLVALEFVPNVVWDAFAGSGAFGIECLSRWPNTRAIFTDVAPDTVKRNLNAIDIDDRATVYAADALARATQIGPSADLIFIDPPYADAKLGMTLMRKLAPVARAGTIIIWEQEAENFTAPDSTTWDTLRDKQYGRARFLLLQRR